MVCPVALMCLRGCLRAIHSTPRNVCEKRTSVHKSVHCKKQFSKKHPFLSFNLILIVACNVVVVDRLLFLIIKIVGAVFALELGHLQSVTKCIAERD